MHSKGQVTIRVKCDVTKRSGVKTTLMWRRSTSEEWTCLLSILLQHWTVPCQLLLPSMAWSCLFLEYSSPSPNSPLSPPCCPAKLGLAYCYISVSQKFCSLAPLSSKITTDPHILAQVNMQFLDYRHPKLKTMSQN